MPDIDEILQTQLEAIESGRPVEEVLQGLSDEAFDLEPLIKLATAVRELPHPEFEFEKAQAARQRVLAASQAITRPAIRRRPVPGLSQRWFTIPGFAALAALFLGALILLSAAGVWLAGPPGGRSALVTDVNGRVEAAAAQGEPEWRAIYSGDRVYANERIRSFGASEATLVFYEGSRATIGANADLALNTIQARWGKSLEVEIEQNTGKTEHSVIPLRGKNSSYVVQAPGASASVQGTTFSVAVSDNGQSHFAVHSGKVQVANDRNQVLITAGQATLAQPNQTLETPAYTFSVAGQMTTATANTWKVAGVNFILNEQTSINGTPVVGDDLIVTGRIIAANTFIADNIAVALISQPSASFTGVIQHQGETAWLVSDQNVLVNAASIIAVDLLIGDPVFVTYTVLDDGEWLAQSIASLDEATELIPESAIPSPVPGAKPALEFVSEELESDICDTKEYVFDGSLLNAGDQEGDIAANVSLGWQIERGANYVESIELTDSEFTEIASGQTVNFTLRVNLNDSWDDAAGKNGHVILRIVVDQETNRPNHHKSRMTINITACNQTEATDEPVPSLEPTQEPSRTPAPRVTPDFCNGDLIHPTGDRLAKRYTVPYEEIMSWFCSGFGFGEIDLAYTLANQYKLEVEDIFEMKEPGKTWGQIKQDLLEIEKEKEKVKPTQKPRPDLEDLKPTQKPKPVKERTLPAVVPTRKS
jgi:mannose-6-phosphate isomerase-like protein (cupin superfamily)